MAPVGPWAQPKATRREGGRRAERPVGSYATPDTPCSRTARRAPADRSPRREAGRAASGVAVPLAFFCTLFFRHRKKSVSAPWDGKSQSAPESARQTPPAGGVRLRAHQRAFRSPFGNLRSPLEAIERPIGLQALLPRRSRHVRPRRGDLLTAKLSPIAASRGLSSGQTIGAARTTVRPASCVFPPAPKFPPFRRKEPHSQ